MLGIVRMILGNVHVGASFPAALRAVVERLREGAWRAMSRADRRAVVRAVVREHKHNRGVYAYVMGGARRCAQRRGRCAECARSFGPHFRGRCEH
jgi:hypothetical protein